MKPSQRFRVAKLVQEWDIVEVPEPPMANGGEWLIKY